MCCCLSVWTNQYLNFVGAACLIIIAVNEIIAQDINAQHCQSFCTKKKKKCHTRLCIFSTATTLELGSAADMAALATVLHLRVFISYPRRYTTVRCWRTRSSSPRASIQHCWYAWCTTWRPGSSSGTPSGSKAERSTRSPGGCYSYRN